MRFNDAFERRVNEQMQEGQAGPAPRSSSPTPSFTDCDIKKRPHSLKAPSIYEAEDLDLSSKGEKTLPPRFSTLFGTSTSAPPPPPTPRVVECCHRESKKKGGIYLSTPVFILLVVVLLFESTLLFAYTIIGLYQNLPSGLLAIGGAPARVDGCHCEDRPGAINFSPNFVFGDKDGSLLNQLSGIDSLTSIPTSTASAATASLSSRSSITTSDTAEAAAASQVLSLFGNDKSTSPSIAVVTSTPGVVQSTIVVTSSASSAPTESAPKSTVTSVQIVDGPETTIQARSPTSAIGMEGGLLAT